MKQSKFEQLVLDHRKQRDEILKHFNYEEDYSIHAIIEELKSYWYIEGDEVVFSEERGFHLNRSYVDLYRCPLLINEEESVFKSSDYTMMEIDPQSGFNKWLMIFSNDKQVTPGDGSNE